MNPDDPTWIVRVIAHRVPELTDNERSLIEQALTGQIISSDLLDQLLAVIDALAERVAALDEAVEEANRQAA
jgi:hypothetical protein